MTIRRTFSLTATFWSLTTAALAQFPNSSATNLAIADGPAEQVVPKIALAPDGSSYIGWFDNAGSNYDLRLQHLSPTGVELWPHGGLLVSNHPQSSSLVDWQLIATTQGHAVLTFADIRAGGDLDIYAYALDAAGNQLWGTNGIALSNDGDYEAGPHVTEASNGDLVFIWARLPNGLDGRILMQRVSTAGSVLLASGGLTIAAEAGKSPAFCDIAPADNGNVIVSWIRDVKTFQSLRYLRAQNFRPSGVPAWPVPVEVFDALSLPIAYLPKVLPDGAGGALLTWHCASGSLYNSFVQRLTIAGAELFPHNGVTVSTISNMNHLDPSSGLDTVTGEIFVFWSEENSGQSQWGVHGQKFDSAGVRQWGTGGIAILPVDTTYKILPQCVPCPGGAMVFHLQQPAGQPNRFHVLGHRLDTSGNKLWLGGSPLTASSTSTSKSRLIVKSSATSFARILWEDENAGTRDVRAAGIDGEGPALGAPGVKSFGSGTAGCAGAEILTAPLLPKVGQSAFTLDCGNAPPLSLGLCLVANAADPIGSDSLGVGILLYMDFLAATEVLGLDMPVNATGTASAAAPIPNVPALAGSTYYAQAIFSWGLTCPLPPFGLSSSSAVELGISLP